VTSDEGKRKNTRKGKKKWVTSLRIGNAPGKNSSKKRNGQKKNKKHVVKGNKAKRGVRKRHSERRNEMGVTMGGKTRAGRHQVGNGGVHAERGKRKAKRGKRALVKNDQ